MTQTHRVSPPPVGLCTAMLEFFWGGLNKYLAPVMSVSYWLELNAVERL